MAESPVIYALRDKRARLAGYIQDLENRLKNSYANLAHLDATILLFRPDADPGKIEPKRTYMTRADNVKGDTYRAVLDVLREASSPLLTAEIAELVMALRGRDLTNAVARRNMVERVGPILRRLRRRGQLAKIGAGPKTRWEIVR
jgi:hypothetical protein